MALDLAMVGRLIKAKATELEPLAKDQSLRGGQTSRVFEQVEHGSV